MTAATGELYAIGVVYPPPSKEGTQVTPRFATPKSHMPLAFGRVATWTARSGRNYPVQPVSCGCLVSQLLIFFSQRPRVLFPAATGKGDRGLNLCSLIYWGERGQKVDPYPLFFLFFEGGFWCAAVLLMPWAWMDGVEVIMGGRWVLGCVLELRSRMESQREGLYETEKKLKI